MADTDDKYIVFKREDFETHIYGDPAPPYIEYELQDAVVIRRQDKFASPALATYAACIAMVAMEHPDPQTKAELLAISDYFEDQAKLAADEGFKLPDR